VILNEEYSISDVRYAITRQRNYDTMVSFVGRPNKVQLVRGERLCRLDFPVVSGLFTKTWWMQSGDVQQMLAGTAPSSNLRQEWQNRQAMPKAYVGVRTQIFEIEITAPVFAWIGRTSALFNRPGGATQIFLPNLAHGAGPDQSHFARLRRTYLLPAS
jgi:hypothetical protein